ncbi:MAG TPA: hypothetical protein VK689_19080 [Armatimonadota bacterium]|nr:hypothetical protein [Armatimonadota bacterium]
MRKNPRLLILLSTLLLILALGAGVWLLLADPNAQRQRLADGTILKLEGVTYGRQHALSVGAPWQKLLSPVLPARFQPRLVPGRTFGEDRIVCWFSESPSYNERARRPGFDWMAYHMSQPAPWPELLDDHGSRMGRAEPGVELSGPAPFQTIALTSYPRRGRSIRLRYYNPQGRTPVAEFVIPNPDPGPHPVWNAEPLPATRSSGALKFTLQELRRDLKRRRLGPEFASFRVSQNGRPTWDWEPVELTLADATGNSLVTLGSRSERNGETLVLRWYGALPSGEAAWKLRVTFFPTPRAPAPPGATWTLQGIPAPKKDGVTVLQKAAVIQGVRLTIIGLARAGKPWWPGEPKPKGGDSATPEVRVIATGRRKDQRVTLLASDEQGRTFAGYDSHGWADPKQQQFRYYLNLPPDSRKLTLRFVVSTGRTVEFLAKPPDASAPGSTPASDSAPGG